MRINCIFTILFFLLLFLSTAANAQCNGYSELCSKRYDEVAFLTTHNAFNAGNDGFQLPNHNYGVKEQMEAGVRAFMLDIYDENGVVTLYHGFSFLGTRPLLEVLQDIEAFLSANPNEILTIIFECYVGASQVATVFDQAGLLPYIYEHIAGQTWPSLQQMIDSNERLVVLSDCNDAGPGEAWYHYVWDLAVETPFSNSDTSDFSCTFNRGDPSNDLFILNHFLTDPNIGVGVEALSSIANEFDYFYDRAVKCQNSLGKFPNFPTVDFYELGDCIAVVNALNGVSTSVSEAEFSNSIFSAYPNPFTDQLILHSDTKWDLIRVYTIDGRLISEIEWVPGSNNLQIDTKDWDKGIYFLSAYRPSEMQRMKLIK